MGPHGTVQRRNCRILRDRGLRRRDRLDAVPWPRTRRSRACGADLPVCLSVRSPDRVRRRRPRGDGRLRPHRLADCDPDPPVARRLPRDRDLGSFGDRG